MQEEFEKSEKENNPRVQLDHEVISAMLKAWLTPRSTGNMSNSDDSDKSKITGSFKSKEKSNLVS